MLATAIAAPQAEEAAPEAPAKVAALTGGAQLAAVIGNRAVARVAGHGTSRAELPRATNEGPALAAGARALSNAVLARQTTVDVTVGPGGCSIAQHREIEPAVRTASAWLRRSIELLDAYIAAPDAPGNSTTRTSLQRNFRTTATAAATTVRGHFSTILNDMLNSRTLRTECHTNTDASCGAANAYVTGSTYVFCPIFFNFTPLNQAMSVVHEMAHAVTGGSITDRAYRTNRYYRWMTPGEAITNAESYGLLAQELGTGTQVADSAPRDTIEDCPDDWDLALARSTAIAERWNRNAQTALADRRPAWLSQWTDLQTRYLGGTSTATLDSAKRIYDATLNAFRDNIAFECEPGATGGRCASSQTYWYGAFSDFHICPSWRALPTEARRTQALLQGFFGYKDVEGDDTRRANLAALARELSERYWPSVP